MINLNAKFGFCKRLKQLFVKDKNGRNPPTVSKDISISFKSILNNLITNTTNPTPFWNEKLFSFANRLEQWSYKKFPELDEIERENLLKEKFIQYLPAIVRKKIIKMDCMRWTDLVKTSVQLVEFKANE